MLMPSALRYASHMEKLQEARDNQNLASKQRDVKAYYLYGPTGVGKTSGLIAFYGAENVFRVSSYKHPWDSYRSSQKILILDEFNGQIPFDLLLNVLARYPLLLPSRYRDRYAAFTEVWVVSNLPLERFYEDVRLSQPARWAALMRRFLGMYELHRDGGVTIDYLNEFSEETKREGLIGAELVKDALLIAKMQRQEEEEEARARAAALFSESKE